MANNWEALNIAENDKRTAKDVLSEFYGKEYTNDQFADVFGKINASDFAKAYQAGLLPTEEEARAAVESGQYVKGSNDYIVERLHDIFELDGYNDTTGFVSKGATHENVNIPQLSQESLDRTILSAGGGNGVHFAVGDARYVYNPQTGLITRKNDGKVVSGVDEINQYARDTYNQFSDRTSIDGSTDGSYSDGNTGYGYDGAENGYNTPSSSGSTYVPNNGGSITGGVSGTTSTPTTSTPITGGNVTGGTTSVPTTGSTTTGGSSTGIVNNKTGADALADYLSALKIDSDFSKNLNTSRENLESKYNTLFEDLRTGDYTQKPYYQTILESYGIKGDAAANNASASGAAANAGNLDSYAAANAQRQQLAFKNAAESAALNAYNSEVASLLQTLSDLGVNVNDLYNTWASELDSQRSGAVNAYLGQLGAETDKYVSDNALAGDKYTADTNKYLGNLELEGTKYQTDAQKYLGDVQASIDKYLGDLQASTDKYVTDANVQMNAANNAANKELADLEVKYNTEMAALDRQHELLKQEMVNASSERIAQIEKEIREIEATKAETTAKYEADMKYAAELTKANADANKKAEEEKKTEDTGNGKLKPTDSMYNSALKAYNDGGVSGLADYLATVPAYDIDLLYEYAIKNGLYYAENVAEKNEYPSLKNPVTHGGGGVVSDKNVSLYN